MKITLILFLFSACIYSQINDTIRVSLNEAILDTDGHLLQPAYDNNRLDSMVLQQRNVYTTVEIPLTGYSDLSAVRELHFAPYNKVLWSSGVQMLIDSIYAIGMAGDTTIIFNKYNYDTIRISDTLQSLDKNQIWRFNSVRGVTNSVDNTYQWGLCALYQNSMPTNNFVTDLYLQFKQVKNWTSYNKLIVKIMSSYPIPSMIENINIQSVNRNIMICQNPFISMIQGQLYVKIKSAVDISLYNVSGENIAFIYKGIYNPGTYPFIYMTTGLQCGVYFLRSMVNKKVETYKMVKIQ
jgi:hypothetical protein